MDLHRTLMRQMRRCGIAYGDAPSPEAFTKFVELLSGTYAETEQAQRLNDRALDLASAEMQQLYENMEGLVGERTQEIEQAQAELIAINEQLQEQSQELEQQHEDIHRTNVELELKTEALDLEKARLEERNSELKSALEALELRASQLTQMSQYKSSFLASMSHELRTPLNSLLILAEVVSRNEDGNLTDDQVESVQTIYDAGSDLLHLINQILDLARIESGGMALEVLATPIDSLINSVESIIIPIARDKGLALAFDTSMCTVTQITTDATKAGQVLKNLLSNACKFTPDGEVTVVVSDVDADTIRRLAPTLPPGVPHISITVTDSGIGIEQGMQEEIFEAFKQGETGTSRRFGGTGLGLAISREMARLLGGDVHLYSVVGQGSTFTFFLPVEFEGSTVPLEPNVARTQPEAVHIEPESAPVAKSRTLLIVEDDVRFAEIVRKEAITQGFDPIVANDGMAALRMAGDNNLAAMTLDLRLPDMTGWQVLAAIQADPKHGAFPVAVMSVDDESTTRTAADIFKYLTKPVSRRDLQLALRDIARTGLPETPETHAARSALLVLPDIAESALLAHMLKSAGASVDVVESGSDAVARIRREVPTVTIVDVAIDGDEGLALIESLHAEFADMPIIGVTESQPTPLDSKTLADSTLVTVHKGPRVYDRLIDEVSLYFHSLTKEHDSRRKEHGEPDTGAVSQANVAGGTSQTALRGFTVLVVDDDRRNVFALRKLLEQQGCSVLEARDGREAVETVMTTDGIDAVLMDIMMPGMDGYEAMGLIRAQDRLAGLPIIALTALAMSEDKEKCIQAGATDYVSKPIDTDRLLSLLSLWLQK